MIDTPDTKPKRGERRRIGSAECVWTGARWAQVDDLKSRLQELEATARFNTCMGAPALALPQRQDARHIRELLVEVSA